jgi:predicted DNA-binding protein with PD1-like motif
VKGKQLSEISGQKTFALIFDTGDEVMQVLLDFAKERRLAGCHFTGIGAFQDSVLGYFDWQKKDYKKIPVREQVEVLSLVGDVAEKEDGAPQIHAHVVVGTSTGNALGGHLLEAHVRPTLELILTESPVHLRRRHDPKSGLALINV